eukprot:g4284.t1
MLAVFGFRNDYLLRRSDGSSIDGKPYGLSGMVYKSNWERSVDKISKIFMSDRSFIDFDTKYRSHLLKNNKCTRILSEQETDAMIFHCGNYANHASYGNNNVDYIEKTFRIQDYVFYHDLNSKSTIQFENISNKKNRNLEHTNANGNGPNHLHQRTICLLPYVLHSGTIRLSHDSNHAANDFSLPGVVLVANRDIQVGEEIVCCYNDIKIENERYEGNM